MIELWSLCLWWPKQLASDVLQSNPTCLVFAASKDNRDHAKQGASSHAQANVQDERLRHVVTTTSPNMNVDACGAPGFWEDSFRKFVGSYIYQLIRSLISLVCPFKLMAFCPVSAPALWSTWAIAKRFACTNANPSCTPWANVGWDSRIEEWALCISM